jgi:hypothetical protein
MTAWKRNHPRLIELRRELDAEWILTVASEGYLGAWARKRWHEFETAGPLVVLPQRTSYADNAWVDNRANAYAALYPKEGFIDLLDANLFVRFSSSIQQDQIAGGEPAVYLRYFLPESARDGVNHFLREMRSVSQFWRGEEVAREIGSWCLPDEFQWMAELGFHEGVIHARSEEAALMAKTEDGYLCFFAVDG